LTDEEFADLTPGQFQELAKRRNVRIRHERYASALAAAAVYNVNRASNDAPVITAFDFIRDEKQAAKLEKLQQAKNYIRQAIGQMPMTTPRAKYLEIRGKAITDLTASGHNDAEALFDSVWPHLKPTQEEKEGDKCQKSAH
jgi:hypothetical protein